MLRLIAGLLEPTTGKILFAKTVVNSVPPHKRNVGVGVPELSLFPHMTVFQNVAFGLRMRGVNESNQNPGSADAGYGFSWERGGSLSGATVWRSATTSGLGESVGHQAGRFAFG